MLRLQQSRGKLSQLVSVKLPVSVITTPYETRVQVALAFIETDCPGLNDSEFMVV